jgi:PAS domain-containing protein
VNIDNPHLMRSWPLWDRSKHFELGLILNSAITDALPPMEIGEVSAHHAGCWECNLINNSLIWSGGVYDLFGLPRGGNIDRKDVVPLYSVESRAAMESLRSYAIKHRRGFTLDVDIHPATGDRRRMRLITAPIVEGDVVVKLHGLKFVI